MIYLDLLYSLFKNLNYNFNPVAESCHVRSFMIFVDVTDSSGNNNNSTHSCLHSTKQNTTVYSLNTLSPRYTLETEKTTPWHKMLIDQTQMTHNNVVSFSLIKQNKLRYFSK